MSNETRKISSILNSLPEWGRWNNYDKIKGEF